MRQLFFLGVLFVLLCLASCRQTDNGHLLQLADEQVQMSVDSVYSLLSKIEEPSRLSEEDKLLYGWLWAYVHYSWNSSMVEDTLVVRAGDQYIARQDTGRMLLSYLLKAKYYHWAKEREHSVALLDTGVEAALALCDTTMAVEMLDLQADEYTYTWKDYRRTVASLKQALALKESAGIYFSLGIAMGLLHHDSASFYFERSVQMVFQERDTNKTVHYLRNYAQLQAYVGTEYTEAIDCVRRMEQLTTDASQLMMGYMVRTEAFLKMGQLDSAQLYLNIGKAMAAGEQKFPTCENMISHYQSMIDYSRHRTFDILNIMRYNDSVGNALFELKSTIRRKNESKESLSKTNLLLTIERQQAQLTLLFSLLALVLVGGGAYLSIRRRRNRLIEAEERIETLKRLLADATKDFGQDTDGEESAAEVEDGIFFRKILLQQLGIIRLVATQPTSQNQEMLRRISGITNGQLPVESLLVWEDLYPVIDRVYDHFYTNMYQRFGSLLIDKEQQLCCLLCAEFSTKEISVVTQQSIPTIYQRKTNIRKKLGVGEKEDIVEFILKK